MPHGMEPPGNQYDALHEDLRGLHADIVAYMAAQLEKMNVWIYREAEALASEARDAIDLATDRNENVGGLSLSVRYRQGQWGPRIVWIRIGKPMELNSGKRAATRGWVPRETREIPMPSGTWVHLNTFRRLPEPLASQLVDVELRARKLRRLVVRYRQIALNLNPSIDAEVTEPSRTEVARRVGGRKS